MLRFKPFCLADQIWFFFKRIFLGPGICDVRAEYPTRQNKFPSILPFPHPRPKPPMPLPRCSLPDVVKPLQNPAPRPVIGPIPIGPVLSPRGINCTSFVLSVCCQERHCTIPSLGYCLMPITILLQLRAYVNNYLHISQVILLFILYFN